MESYSKAAMERAMKVQEVTLRAMAKKITWWQAAEIIGISDRQMRRWHERLEEFGYDGLFDRRRGRPSPKRVPLALMEQVLGLYRERYFDLNVQHFHEKLGEQHGIQLSYTWVKQALQGAGLVAKGRKRGVHRKRRERRPLPGMLLRSIRSCDLGTPGESIRLAAPRTDFAKVTAARSPLLLCPSPSWLRRCRCRRSHRDRGSGTAVLRPTERLLESAVRSSLRLGVP